MSKITIPEGYKSELNLYDTQKGIKTVKDFFQSLLSENSHLSLPQQRSAELKYII